MVHFDLMMLVLLLPLVTPIILRIWFPRTVTIRELGINVAIVFVAGALCFSLGSFTSVSDVQILNGKVTSKSHERVSCSHSYSCHCRVVPHHNSHGTTFSTVCDTCYEHAYDVDWNVRSTVGSFVIDRIDRQGAAEPPRWTQVVIGEPASRQASFTNYIKASPDSIFHLRQTLSKQFPQIAYPQVYDYYHINRVIVHAVNLPNDFVKDLNDQLNSYLTLTGPTKQFNVVVILTGITDTRLMEAVRQQWLGGKQNDAIVIISTDGKQINWAQVFSWSKNELFNVTLRDDLTSAQLNAEQLSSVINADAMKYFQRRSMEEFAYLKEDYTPPTWVFVTTFILSMLISIGTFVVMHRNDVA